VIVTVIVQNMRSASFLADFSQKKHLIPSPRDRFNKTFLSENFLDKFSSSGQISSQKQEVEIYLSL
jgi:hypothetical protein